MTMALKVILLLSVLVIVKSDLPVDYVVDIDAVEPATKNAGLSFRLPEDFDPIHCDIEITPYFDTAPEGKETFTFDGKAILRIKALKDNLTSIVVQENVRQILSVRITDDNDVPLQEEDFNFERIREFQFLRVFSDDTIIQFTNGEIYKLYVEYLGNINETPLSRGMFRGYYRDSDNNKRWYAATHLQPTHSRQLFPSFDEPGFKSTFNIIVNRPSNFSETFSNMKIKSNETVGDYVKETFHTTPRMSAYLISIHIHDGFEVIADNDDDEKSYRIIARPTAANQGKYALEVGPPLTKWFDDYFGIDYYTMHDGIKNDQLASPFWASGATENWGLVTYRETRLLYEAGETNALDKMYVGTITAHELAHKWFGNYITCRWWDNVWINEGFASYFEYFGMDGIDKDLELEDQFNIMYLQSALSADSATNTRALQHTVNSPAEVTGHFTGISYSKGASLLNMLKHFLTEDTFKKALHLFLVDRAFEHAFPEDLYKAFDNATQQDNTLIDSVDITEFMDVWVNQQGYPVLNVDVNMGTGLMRLSQERFYIDPPASPSEDIWPLPLTFTAGTTPDYDNLTVSHVLLEKTGEIQKAAGHEYVIFNVQQKGIYRVNYDDHNWEMIGAALNRSHSDIHHLNRAQIVDDVFALMRSGRLSFDIGFEVLDFLKKDTSYYSWYPALSGFNWIRNRFLHLPEQLELYDAELFKFLNAVIQDVGYDVAEEPLTKTLNRLFVLSFACNIGHSDCVQDAVTKFKNLVENQEQVNPNLRRHVFCTGLREGGYDDWSFINERRRSSNNQADEIAMLRAMGCTKDERAVNETLEIILSEEVKAQDRLNALTWLFSGGPENARLALQFLQEDNNVQRVRDAVVLPAWFNSVLSNLAAYLDEEGLEDMEDWLQSSQAEVPEFQSGLSAIVQARNNMKWGSDRVAAILKALRGSAKMLIPSCTLFFMALIAMMLK